MKEIKSVNHGICQRRLQEGRPAFFVNWRENGQNNYRFFEIVSFMYSLFDRLKALETK